MNAKHWPGQRRPKGLIEEMLTAGETDLDVICDELGVSLQHVKRVRTAWNKQRKLKGEVPPDGRKNRKPRDYRF